LCQRENNYIFFPVYYQQTFSKPQTESSRSDGHMIGMITEYNESILIVCKQKMESDLYFSNMDELAYWQLFLLWV
jgi:hypothetical protein